MRRVSRGKTHGKRIMRGAVRAMVREMLAAWAPTTLPEMACEKLNVPTRYLGEMRALARVELARLKDSLYYGKSIGPLSAKLERSNIEAARRAGKKRKRKQKKARTA